MCHPEVVAGQKAPAVAGTEVRVPLEGEALPALLVSPESGPGPGVVLIHDIFGRSPFYENLAGRLAGAGFTALLPDLFFRQGALHERTREAAMARRGHFDEAQGQRDLSAAVDWLKGRAAPAARVGTLGFCMGGTYVLTLAAEREDLVSVCFYGFPARPGLSGPGAVPAPIDVAAKMTGPILGFWGDQDEGVGMSNVARLSRELTKHRVEFEILVFPGLGHGFMSASGLDPNHEAYDQACDAWTRTLNFFREQLK